MQPSAAPRRPDRLPLAEAAGRLPSWSATGSARSSPADDPFVARNEARWRDGVLVYVPRGAAARASRCGSRSSGAAGAEVDWRTLIVLEEGAEAEVWERYASDGEVDGLFNGVVELVVGDGANLRYVCEQELSDDAWVFATQRAEVGRDADLEWVALGFGSARGKVRMETKLAGRGLERQGDRRLRRRRQSAPRLRHDPGARRRGHDLRPRLPRRARRAARPRSGGG